MKIMVCGAGVIANRLNKAVQVEALHLLHEGVATCEDIDRAAKKV